LQPVEVILINEPERFTGFSSQSFAGDRANLFANRSVLEQINLAGLSVLGDCFLHISEKFLHKAVADLGPRMQWKVRSFVSSFSIPFLEIQFLKTISRLKN